MMMLPMPMFLPRSTGTTGPIGPIEKSIISLLTLVALCVCTSLASNVIGMTFPPQPEFREEQYVIINSGFYKNYTGQVVDAYLFPGVLGVQWEYTVILNNSFYKSTFEPESNLTPNSIVLTPGDFR